MKVRQRNNKYDCHSCTTSKTNNSEIRILREAMESHPFLARIVTATVENDISIPTLLEWGDIVVLVLRREPSTY
jgi:hypothetical protein